MPRWRHAGGELLVRSAEGGLCVCAARPLFPCMVSPHPAGCQADCHRGRRRPPQGAARDTHAQGALLGSGPRGGQNARLIRRRGEARCPPTPQPLPQKKRLPTPPGWFSSAGVSNIPVAANPFRIGHETECRFLKRVFAKLILVKVQHEKLLHFDGSCH